MAKITPSAPMPKLRSHSAAHRSEDILITSLSRLSTSTKSLPRPWYLAKRTASPAAATVDARARAVRGARGARRETRAPASEDAGKERAEVMADIVLVGDRAGPVAPVGVGAIDARDRLG